MEFCGKRDDTHQIEARTTALCIVLPLASTKELLLNDNRFLRYLLNSVTEKLMLYSSSQSNFFHARGILPLLSLRALSGSDVFRRGKDGHAAPLQPPPAPAGFKEAARRRTACETFERFLPPQLKNAIASLFPRFQDRCSDRSLRHFYAEVLCNGCADHSEGVLRLLRPLSFIDGEYARSGACSLVWSVPV